MDVRRNRLGDERSPYLLQHRNNPVWWQPWDEHALAEARRRDVPIFLSIGYSTCHWCHVMERESFEDDEVARALNERFVAIKVDREERPDLDAIYMDAVQAMGQQGGWPLSAWLTPDRRPFFGGTYFPKPHFLHLLEQIDRLWQNDRERAEEAGAELARLLEASGQRARAGALGPSLLRAFHEQWTRVFDARFGGRVGAPKFPPAYDVRLLLRIARRSGETPSGETRGTDIVTKTLDAIAAGGICDHVGGGFHRYATDERWLVPHFEKMLYDQASLVQAFLDGALACGREEYRLVARETVDYVLRDLAHAEGGFFSAEDADSEGEEGRFYVWTADELRTLLPAAEFEALGRAYGVSDAGNFEHGTTILALRPPHARTSRTPDVAAALHRLADARARRVRPHRDEKILADWNGLMIAACARAGRVLDEPRYVAAARRAMEFVLRELSAPEGGLRHRWADGVAGIDGFLSDYAGVVHALVALAQADPDPRWPAEAARLQDEQDARFRDGATGDYFSTTGRDPSVLQRRVESWDNVTPSGRSLSALNLLELGDLLGRPDLHERAAAVFASTTEDVRRAPAGFAVLLAALDHALDRSKEVAVVGEPGREDTRAMLRALAGLYQPNMVVALAGPLVSDRPARDGRATAYVCERGLCLAPATDPVDAVAQASAFAPLER